MPERTIIRKGYTRKAYTRKAYTRSDGTKVKAAKVKSTRVPPAKIRDVGAPGKGPKLIDMKDTRDLKRFGYTFSKSAESRRRAASKSVNKNGYAWTIRRLNAVRNLSHRTNPLVAKKAVSDMKYLKQKYRPEK